MYVCMHGWMDGWTDGCTDVRMYGCTDVWMYGCMDVWMYVCMYVRMYVCMGVQIKMGVPSNHRTLDHFSIEIYGFWVHPFWETTI